MNDYLYRFPNIPSPRHPVNQSSEGLSVFFKKFPIKPDLQGVDKIFKEWYNMSNRNVNGYSFIYYTKQTTRDASGSSRLSPARTDYNK